MSDGAPGSPPQDPASDQQGARSGQRRETTINDGPEYSSLASPEDPFAVRRLDREDRFRHAQADRLLTFFYQINKYVGLFLLGAYLVEIFVRPTLACDSRLITEHVVLAIIAGTVAKMGALALAAGQGLFRSS